MRAIPGVCIYRDCEIGDNVRIHANSVIGSDGFGYAHTKDGKHIKIYHNGKAVLENDVEIGANTTIDRAVFGETRIKQGTKIDNLVQIGHNCNIGEFSIIVSQAGISGSTSTGRNVVLGDNAEVLDIYISAILHKWAHAEQSQKAYQQMESFLDIHFYQLMIG